MRWPAVLLVPVVVLTGLLLATPAQGATGPDARPALVTDAVGPLFGARQLTVGQVMERCVTATWSQAGASELTLSAAVTGPLAQHLDLEVAVGTGGGYADCRGFRGSTVWTGTLADLGREFAGGAGRLRLAEPTGAGATSVRLRGRVREDARQGLAASASFTFTLTATGPVVPLAARSVPGLTDAGSDPLVSDQGPSGTRPPVSATVPLTPSSGPGVPTRSGWGDAVLEVLHSAMASAMRASGPVARGVGLTFWTIPLLVVFVLVQNRVDARDPKLADSPTHAAPSLPFDERYDGVTAVPVSPIGRRYERSRRWEAS